MPLHVFLALLFLSVLALTTAAFGAGNDDDCLVCHDHQEKVTLTSGTSRSIYVDAEKLAGSVHERLSCVTCHPGARLSDTPPDEVDPAATSHPADPGEVACQKCHSRARFTYGAGIHGQLARKGKKGVPGCVYCHGGHDVLPVADPENRTHRTKSPDLCGVCHHQADGAPFPMKIHGEAYLEKGLVIAALCSDCHGGHLALPATNRRSPVSRSNIGATCGVCHTRIPNIHKEIIPLERWDDKGSPPPGCQTCHPPHAETAATFARTHHKDALCLKCHEEKEGKIGATNAPPVEKETLARSAHRLLTCADCHAGMDRTKKRPCQGAKKVDCKSCHARFGAEYEASAHGQAALDDPAAPGCVDCHGDHDILFHQAPQARTHRLNIAPLCGGCHAPVKREKSGKVAPPSILPDYSKSAHGHATLEEGSSQAATCVDCHQSHKIVSSRHPDSPVNRDAVATTCGRCHRGIYRAWAKSSHALEGVDDKQRPTCADCHVSHAAAGPGRLALDMNDRCGDCHPVFAASYRETLHGKAGVLGSEQVAACADCHGAHLILPGDHPDSTVGPVLSVETCGKCHQGVTTGFTSYLTHDSSATRDNYPVLRYTYLFMTSLLVSVFLFFGLHTILWLTRAFIERRRRGPGEKEGRRSGYVRRFSLEERILHIFVVVSFLSLALTGMTLKFAYQPWAATLNGAMGGVAVASAIHRVAAIVTFGYFVVHLFTLWRRKRASGLGWFAYIFGPDSMMFGASDGREFVANVKWFLGLGPRPTFGRWTYWEKFDYFAVFWGVPVIGLSGLVLWFPEFFTQWAPGWIINLAMIIHSDEALLAVGFIFTIHFFNTHLRPESFPMDRVIFTGLTPTASYERERPRELERIVKEGNREIEEKEWSDQARWYVTILGAFFLIVGIALIVLIIWSLLFA